MAALRRLNPEPACSSITLRKTPDLSAGGFSRAPQAMMREAPITEKRASGQGASPDRIGKSMLRRHRLDFRRRASVGRRCAPQRCPPWNPPPMLNWWGPPWCIGAPC